MKLGNILSTAVLALFAAALPHDDFPWEVDLKDGPSRTLEKRASCTGNTASTRTQWCDYDVTTDYTTTVVDTGVTREYYFDITGVTIAPDGVERVAQAINGSFPGPPIIADWGDTVRVHVTNSLGSDWPNGTTIHFHGIRQNYTNQNDGVSSITQCPIAPGSSYTYEWKAIQYGTSWYHSHWALQAWEGIAGPIIINGPASANYDVDAGALSITDWSHFTADQGDISDRTTGPPTQSNGLINGTNVFGEDGAANQTGYRFNMTVASGTSYRLRLINMAIDTHFKFMIDNHTLTVISTDLVPITPYETDVLNIAIAQRYDVIVTANQDAIASDFWIRAIPQLACSENDSTDNIKGILHYGTNTTISTPNTTAYSFTDACVDEDASNLVPIVSKDAGTLYYNTTEPVDITTDSAGFLRWTMNSTSMQISWEDPTLLQIYNGNTTFSNSSGVVQVPDADVWVYVVIEAENAVPHPIHLHGHDFLVLGSGTGSYNSTDELTLTNPPRRDTATLPLSGWLVVAFQTDNPGAWLMHCHIGWHAVEGFAIQFIERYDEIKALIDYDTLENTCSAWDTWDSGSDIVQGEDSGI
ncbi:hypothetical protein SLS56_007369 [Neofusicoccum ribis]|uniref:Laccase n=1 Tax=Neofusicoccum ribis TaxID=45134 RepID=A0ABR3SN68_9PEZI